MNEMGIIRSSNGQYRSTKDPISGIQYVMHTYARSMYIYIYIYIYIIICIYVS